MEMPIGCSPEQYADLILEAFEGKGFHPVALAQALTIAGAKLMEREYDVDHAGGWCVQLGESLLETGKPPPFICPIN